MEVGIEILAKSQARRLESDDDMYSITFKLEIDGEPVTFQGQAFLPTVQLDRELWVELTTGQELVGELT